MNDNCEHTNGTWGTINLAIRELLGQVNDYQLLKDDSAPMELVNMYLFAAQRSFLIIVQN